MDTQTWLEATKMRLKLREGTLREVAAGAGVDYEWLAKFSQGVIVDPGVTKVEKVYRYLDSKPQNDQPTQ